MLTVLKNHVGLEQFFSEFLEASGKKPDEMSFYEKAKACEGLRPPEVELAIWKVVYAANELRNKIAHTFEQTKIKAKMDALRAAYLAALTPTQAEAAKSWTTRGSPQVQWNSAVRIWSSRPRLCARASRDGQRLPSSRTVILKRRS